MLKKPARSPGAVLLIGKIATLLGQGLMLLILARAYGPVAVGFYTLGLALVTPAFLLGHMGMQEVAATDPHVVERWPAYRMYASFGPLMAMAASAVIAWILGGGELFSVVCALSLLKFVESRVFLSHGYWQNTGQFYRVTVSSLVRATSGTATLAAASMVMDFQASLWTMSAVALLVTPLAERLGRPGISKSAAELPRLSIIGSLLPLGVAAMIISLNQTVLRVMLERQVGLVDLGVFAVSAYAVRLGSLLGQVSGQSIAPSIRRAREERNVKAIDKLGRKAGRRAALAGVALTMIGGVVGPGVIDTLFGAQFTPDRHVFVLILCAGVPLYYSTALSTASIAVQRERSYTLRVSTGILVTILSGLLFIPSYGLAGAAVSWLLGETARALLLAVHLRQAAL